MFYIPPKKPRAACVTGALLFGAAAILYFLGEFSYPRMIYQLSALILVTMAIFIASKFLLTDYKYVISDIESAGSEVTFVIVKVAGKRENVMAKFDIKDVYAIEKCKKVGAFEKAHGKVAKVFNYVSNFMSDDVYMLAIEFNGSRVLFSLELSDKFADEIRARMVPREDQADTDVTTP